MVQHPDNNYIDPIEVKRYDQHAYCFLVNEAPMESRGIITLRDI